MERKNKEVGTGNNSYMLEDWLTPEQSAFCSKIEEKRKNLERNASRYKKIHKTHCKLIFKDFPDGEDVKGIFPIVSFMEISTTHSFLGLVSNMSDEMLNDYSKHTFFKEFGSYPDDITDKEKYDLAFRDVSLILATKRVLADMGKALHNKRQNQTFNDFVGIAYYLLELMKREHKKRNL